MGSEPNSYQNGSKTCYVPKVSKFLANFEVSSLASKFAFYRPERNATAEHHEIEF